MPVNYHEIDEQITGLDVWHLSLPVVSRRDHGIGTIADAMEVVVARITTESGMSGYGEAAPWAPFTGTPEGNFAALDRYLRPLIVAQRLGNLDTILAICDRAVINCSEAKSAIESALLDAAGKLLEQPLWALLGDQCRDKAPMSVSLANPEFDQDLELLKRLQDDGINIVKIKTGFRDDAFDLERIERLRTRYPDLKIRIDYNQGLPAYDAVRCIRAGGASRQGVDEQWLT